MGTYILHGRNRISKSYYLGLSGLSGITGVATTINGVKGLKTPDGKFYSYTGGAFRVGEGEQTIVSEEYLQYIPAFSTPVTPITSVTPITPDPILPRPREVSSFAPVIPFSKKVATQDMIDRFRRFFTFPAKMD